MPKSEPKIITVKLHDIMQNPYRNYKIYPISGEKKERIYRSIRKTGWWGNIVGRMRKDGKVEIAYGHHRIETLKSMGLTKYREIEVIIKKLTDSQMLKMMARENDAAYNCSIAAIDNAVHSAREYLKLHPGEAKKVLTSGRPGVKRIREGAPMYAEFLGMKKDAVENSIERLNLIKEGKIADSAIYMFPSASSADNFIKLVKECGIEIEYQRELAQRLLSQKALSYEAMWNTYIKHSSFEKRIERQGRLEVTAYHCEEYMKKAEGLLYNLYRPLVSLSNELKRIRNEGKTISDVIPQDILNRYKHLATDIIDYINQVAKVLDTKDSLARETPPHK